MADVALADVDVLAWLLTWTNDVDKLAWLMTWLMTCLGLTWLLTWSDDVIM